MGNEQTHGPMAASDLADRLHGVRKRKRAYGGQAAEMTIIRLRLEQLSTEKKRKRGR